jgi:hypothetical protein
MPKLYRYEGFENIGLVANTLTSGNVINAPGTGYSIYLLGSACFSTQRYLETTGSGATIINLGTGMANFPATIKVKENTSVYAVSSQPTTLFYYIDVV